MPGAKPLPEYDLASISVYDGDTLVEISIEDVGEYHGGICVCRGYAFRATQLGISEIWSDEIRLASSIVFSLILMWCWDK